MVDFNDRKNRCILHLKGDINDADYVELTTDRFSEEQSIAIFKFLSLAMIDSLYLTDLYDEYLDSEVEEDFEDDEFDETDEFKDEIYDTDVETELEVVMYTTFRKSELSITDSNRLLGYKFQFIPHYDDYLAHTIEDVKLYKIEDNHMYNYTMESGWSLIF